MVLETGCWLFESFRADGGVFLFSEFLGEWGRKIDRGLYGDRGIGKCLP